ncbi:chemotaxis protein CheB [Methylomicrobium sp. RS1]|uniref:chemotaxis protein CheB n=1 Tax=Candidatus Methylomicrobium oryzae TaxID=2802053 RepID=UPI001922211E|nr:chemotaxis protein CheB [Methylomicrobium sp. RS1]MBL1262766.1 PAS domain-containing protein [Methylomicrobium sp. RS1]
MSVNDNNGQKTPGFPVVGIGASAGGIEALQNLFSVLPPQTGLAFVVIQHLPPDHTSHLPELLGKVCRLPVCEARDGMQVEPDHVYTIAPGEALDLDQGRLRSRPFPANAKVCIDIINIFFKSLAADCGNKAIAVILSGTGSDGAEGAIRIHQAGGTVFVQNPTTAMHGGMPCAAIATGTANHILPVDAIARELLAHTSVAAVHPPAATESEDIAQPLEEILMLIRRHIGSDMSGYKFSPLFWQIQQRMRVRRIDRPHDYAALLREEPAELETLVRSLPIHVTEFFRDPEAWDMLESEVIAPLIRDHRGDRSVRVWTPACSSGEEAYSVAMLLTGQIERLGEPADFRIFATDASPNIVACARHGVFSAAAVESISPERRMRFFYPYDGKYRIKKSLREKLVFAPQHLLADPPFSDMDLVTCRNVLIYLEPYAQQQVVTLLHASLRMGGCLFLGRGESLPLKQGGFEAVSMLRGIYRKVAPLENSPVRFPKHLRRPPPSHTNATLRAESAHPAVLGEFDLPSVLIDLQFNMLHIYGDTSSFLRLPPGQPTLNLLAMVSPAWAADIRIAAQNALAEQQPVTVNGLRAPQTDECTLRIKLTPIQSGEEKSASRLLVSFIRSNGSGALAPRNSSGQAMPDVFATEPGSTCWCDTLSLTIEELAASREELQVLNEELRAVNDQLNLGNEEINDINAQLRDKIQELETQSHVLSSGAVMTLFLDKELRVRWFTPAIGELFPLRPCDTGRQITDLEPRFVDPHFIDDVQAVIRAGEPLEGEVRNMEGRWYLRRIGPFHIGNDKTAGVAITFTDITEHKRAEEEAQAQHNLLKTVLDHLPVAVNIVRASDMNILLANPKYQELAPQREMVGKTLREVWPEEAEIEKLFLNVAETGKPFSVTDAFYKVKSSENGPGEKVYFSWSVFRIALPGDAGWGLITTAWETTDRKRTEETLRQTLASAEQGDRMLAALMEYLPEGIVIADAPDAKIRMISRTGREMTGKPDRQLKVAYGKLAEQWGICRADGVTQPDDDELPLVRSIRNGETVRDEVWVIVRKDGRHVPVLCNAGPIRDAKGNITGGIVTFRDISRR